MATRPATESARRNDASRRAQRRARGPASVEHQVPGQRVRISGCVDAATVADVRTGLHDAVDRGSGELVVEVSDFELGDATGLGALLGAHRRATRAGRTLVLADVPAALDRVLTFTRLGRVLTTRGTASA